MPSCPQCDNPVTTDALRCPHCNETLKAFGHPGIPLHRATKQASLCESCLYDRDDSCTFPQRPDAKTCTLYRDVSQLQPETERVTYRVGGMAGLKAWCDLNRGWLMAGGLLGASLWLALR
ncbi:zinc ribbon domain-containing protein [Oscillatoria sp. FACHB-1406]|uniref:zinc ribbon domain-containing protein n=1 Tax=Oscillatoria sp. FACHB-1406 TaxID=2692846 RepID=UPI0016852610|nr:zinc ribbon domain-containing protein [Oscillatoria sp. FACHB-1406]MBD2578488.1 zinc ribbon domain-containing protein [Oscillatoria sp. FACHB-1406]